MLVLLTALNLFCLAFILHVIFFRLHIFRRHVITLLCIFFGTLILGLITLLIISLLFCPHFTKIIPKNLSEYLHIILFFISLTSAYIITYSAIEVDSPSLLMITHIAQAGLNGLGKEKIDILMNNDILIKPRIEDLLKDNFIYKNGQNYILTPKGIFLSRIFILFRKFLSLNMGG